MSIACTVAAVVLGRRGDGLHGSHGDGDVEGGERPLTEATDRSCSSGGSGDSQGQVPTDHPSSACIAARFNYCSREYNRIMLNQSTELERHEVVFVVPLPMNIRRILYGGDPTTGTRCPQVRTHRAPLQRTAA